MKNRSSFLFALWLSFPCLASAQVNDTLETSLENFRVATGSSQMMCTMEFRPVVCSINLDGQLFLENASNRCLAIGKLMDDVVTFSQGERQLTSEDLLSIECRMNVDL